MLSQKYIDNYKLVLINNYFSIVYFKDRLFTLKTLEDNLYQRNLRFSTIIILILFKLLMLILLLLNYWKKFLNFF